MRRDEADILNVSVSQSLLSQRIAQLAVAILLAAIAAAIHRSFVFSQFAPIRVDVIGAELHSSNQAVKVTLPDLSAFRGQSAVLAWSLRNTRSEQRRIGVLRDGFPNTRVVLPPERAVRWNIVLSPEAVRALAEERGDAARSVELMGDADGWALSGLEIRNYHVRLGDRLMVGLPREADTYTSATGFLPVGIALSLFVLVTALGPRSRRRSLRLIGNGLALAAFLVCLTCLILPLISPYKVLLSQPAFWLVAAGLFSPGLLGAAPQLPVWSRRFESVDRSRWPASSAVCHLQPSLDASRGDVRTRRRLARAHSNCHRTTDLRSGVEQSRIFRRPEHRAADGGRGGARYLFRSSFRAARDRACDSNGQLARGGDVLWLRIGTPVGSCRDTRARPGRRSHAAVGHRYQRRRGTWSWQSPQLEAVSFASSSRCLRPPPSSFRHSFSSIRA